MSFFSRVSSNSHKFLYDVDFFIQVISSISRIKYCWLLSSFTAFFTVSGFIGVYPLPSSSSTFKPSRVLSVIISLELSNCDHNLLNIKKYKKGATSAPFLYFYIILLINILLNSTRYFT